MVASPSRPGAETSEFSRPESCDIGVDSALDQIQTWRLDTALWATPITAETRIYILANVSGLPLLAHGHP